MANILEQYGIKEVANVTIYDISTNLPALFLDTLKVSTVEQTASQTEATGGMGNSPLIIWDYGKEINVTLEDALYSPASMAIMFGDGGVDTISSVTRMEKVVLTSAVTTISAGVRYFKPGTTVAMSTCTTGDLTAGATVYRETTLSTGVTGSSITVTAETFPGTYKLVGETYSHKRSTGKDDNFQFIINQAKMSAENNITLQAEGDPSTFNMNMRVLRPDNGKMMELKQYSITA